MTILNIEQFIDALSPWVEYGGRIAMAESEVPPSQRDEILRQVLEGVQLLKAFRSAQTETYLEDGVQVTHSQTIVRDVE